MQSENMTSGFDLSYPLISRPEPTQESKSGPVSVRIDATPREKMSGFDLSWPLMSRPAEDVQEENLPSKKAA
jgi:hypothetical protein